MLHRSDPILHAIYWNKDVISKIVYLSVWQLIGVLEYPELRLAAILTKIVGSRAGKIRTGKISVSTIALSQCAHMIIHFL